MPRWTNKDNTDFYDATAQNQGALLRKFAVDAGVDSHCDLQKLEEIHWIAPNIQPIFVIGGGYGRELEWLIPHHFTHITVIERCPLFAAKLRQEYAPVVTVLNEDARNLMQLHLGKCKLILWLWCGICDFSKEEQVFMLQLLMSHLDEEQGLLIVDVPIDTNATAISGQGRGQEHEIRLENTPLYTGYVPCADEMRAYARNIKARTLSQLHETTTGRQRSLWCFFSPQRKEIPLTPDVRKAVYAENHARLQLNRQKGSARESQPAPTDPQKMPLIFG